MARGPGAKTEHVPAASAVAPADAAVRPPAVVGLCTADDALLVTLRDAAPDVVVAGVETPQALADAIVARGCFAAFLDVRTLRGSLATLVPALARQFPGLPIVAIGTRAEEAEVARLIGSGEVYRFLHVPVSMERARTFVGAAQRRADELQQRRAAARAATGGEGHTDDGDDDGPRDGVAAASRRVPPAPRAPVAPAAQPARSAPPRSNVRAALFAVTALGLAVAAGTTWWSRPEPVPPAATTADRVVADLVGAAAAAVAAGELLAPAGRNAAEYYAQALARRPDDTEARAALLALADRMLGAGERALVGGRWQEAELAATTVGLVRARDPRVLALRTRAAAFRAAAESTPVASEPAAPPVAPPSGNTDERAAFEDARDAPLATAAGASGTTPSPGAITATDTVRSAATAAVERGATPSPGTASPHDAAPSTSTAASAATASGGAQAPRVADATGTALAAPPAGVPAGPIAAPVAAPVAAPAGVPVAPVAAPVGLRAPPVASPTASPTSRTPLRRIEDAAVVYPPRARSRGIEGWVDVAFTVDPSGRVIGARVLSAQPIGTFDEAALDAVRRWRYAPVPAPQDANVRLRFQLER